MKTGPTIPQADGADRQMQTCDLHPSTPATVFVTTGEWSGWRCDALGCAHVDILEHSGKPGFSYMRVDRKVAA
jgi:hypothetical protein